MGIGAVIFDFNGVLVDDESVHFALFQEVLAQEGVAITDRDYHERYLGYDDRGCFEAALRDAGQSADRARLDELIARKARRVLRGRRAGPAILPRGGRDAAGRGVPVAGGHQLGSPAARDRVRPSADGLPRPGVGDRLGRGYRQLQASSGGLPAGAGRAPGLLAGRQLRGPASLSSNSRPPIAW